MPITPPASMPPKNYLITELCEDQYDPNVSWHSVAPRSSGSLALMLIVVSNKSDTPSSLPSPGHSQKQSHPDTRHYRRGEEDWLISCRTDNQAGDGARK